jgi:hypothetical protein
MSILSKGTIKVQVNVLIPAQWKDLLENEARKRAVQAGENITYQDLIRDAIQNVYKLPDM